MEIDWKDGFMLAEDIPNIDFFFSQIWLKSFVNSLENACGKNYKKVLAIFHGYNMKYYFGKEDCLEFAKHIVNMIINDPSFGEKVNNEIIARSDEMVKNAEEIEKIDLKSLSNEEFFSIAEKHFDLHTKLYEYGWLSNASDMFYPEFTNYLKNIIKKRLPEENENKIIIPLTTPEEKSEIVKEQESLFDIVRDIKNDPEMLELFQKGDVEEIRHKIIPAINKKIKTHWKKYRQIKCSWYSEPANIKDYYKEIVEIIKSNVEEVGQRIERERKEKLLEKLSDKERRLFEIYSKFMITKIYRRYAQFRALYYMSIWLNEYCERTNLSIFEARQLLLEEMKDILFNEKFPRNFEERKKGFVFYAEKGENIIKTGKVVEEIEERLKEKIGEIAEIKGTIASMGHARGKVKIVNSAKDMEKFEEGNILVAIATNPDLVPAMKKAAAIVTDQGGVTSHAALVSRELGVPCVIGTKVATKALKDGDVVEVNATQGIITIIKRA